MARASVAVVGAGVVDVVVYEQFRVGHTRGSSHGRSRIYRLAYEDPEWVRFAQEAVEGWRRLEAEAGETLLEENGLVEVVHDLEQSSAAALDACGVAWEQLDPGEAERRFPVRVPPDSIAVAQPEAGIIRADRAVAAFAGGLEIREGARIESPADLDAGAVVVAAGPWVNRLADPPLAVKVTRETVAYFRVDDPRPVPSVVTFKPEGGHDVYALADPDRLLQALTNLLTNAAQHSDGAAAITLSSAALGGRVALRVSDTGRGIPPRELPHIFERLFRGSRARATASGGAGLGLAIAASIVEAMDGKINVRSAEGVGTTFTITLPVRAVVTRRTPFRRTPVVEEVA